MNYLNIKPMHGRIKNFLSVLLFLLLFSSGTYSQNIVYARAIVDTLASPFMQGRGYINRGDSIAAEFIAREFSQWDLRSFDKDYFQPFNISVNTFPGDLVIRTGGREFVPGSEFIVRPASHGAEGRFRVKQFNRSLLNNRNKLNRFLEKDHTHRFIFMDIDLRSIGSRDTLKLIDSLFVQNAIGARGILRKSANLTWHVFARPMREQCFTAIEFHSDAIDRIPRTIHLDIDNEYLFDYKTRNVIGYIKGAHSPDTFIVFAAHFDHLGMMGKETLFAGANDNASGTALMTDLARHYSQPENQPYYSIAFMAFAAEEAGLLGSKYYTENPFFPLEQIKFLINLDMVGTGNDGLFVFNANADPARLDKILAINEAEKLFPEIRPRDGSRNSDHYYFHKQGVPAFFLLTFDNEHRHYHDIYDTREALPLTRYTELFRLITRFVEQL